MASKKKNVADFSSDRPPKTIGDLFYGLQLDEEQLTFANAIWSPENDIVFVDAKAGTGKNDYCRWCSQFACSLWIL